MSDRGKIYYYTPDTEFADLDPRKGSGKGARLLRNEPGIALWNSLNGTLRPSGTIRVATCWIFKESSGRKCKACGGKRRVGNVSKAVSKFSESLNSRWLPENVQTFWTHQVGWKRCGSSVSGRSCRVRCSTYMFALVDIGSTALSDKELRNGDLFIENAQREHTEIEKLLSTESNGHYLPVQL